MGLSETINFIIKNHLVNVPVLSMYTENEQQTIGRRVGRDYLTKGEPDTALVYFRFAKNTDGIKKVADTFVDQYRVHEALALYGELGNDLSEKALQDLAKRYEREIQTRGVDATHAAMDVYHVLKDGPAIIHLGIGLLDQGCNKAFYEWFVKLNPVDNKQLMTEAASLLTTVIDYHRATSLCLKAGDTPLAKFYAQFTDTSEGALAGVLANTI